MGCTHHTQVPAAVVDAAPRLFFRPTCTGAASAREVSVRNVSGVPLAWRWVVGRKLDGVVHVEPQVRVVTMHWADWHSHRKPMPALWDALLRDGWHHSAPM